MSDFAVPSASARVRCRVCTPLCAYEVQSANADDPSLAVEIAKRILVCGEESVRLGTSRTLPTASRRVPWSATEPVSPSGHSARYPSPNATIRGAQTEFGVGPKGAVLIGAAEANAGSGWSEMRPTRPSRVRARITYVVRIAGVRCRISQRFSEGR